MIGRLLCKIGLHKWTPYWTVPQRYEDDAYLMRRCGRCYVFGTKSLE